jgi:hypothetical protein
MTFRIATLNLEQDHKRWEMRRQLVTEQFGKLCPDLWALNEIHIPSQTGRWLQRAASQETGTRYVLVQQSKAGEDGRAQSEGLLSRYPIIETANLDYHSHDCVALVARVEIDGRLLDVYVTHLIAAKVDDTARQVQVTRLLEWIRSRGCAGPAIEPSDGGCLPCDARPTDRIHAAARTRRRTYPSGVAAVRSLHRLHLGLTSDKDSRDGLMFQRASESRS